jgi:hypothetical protein
MLRLALAAALDVAGFALMNSVIAADFNHDGRIDLAGGIVTAGVAVLLNISQPAPLTVVSAASFAVARWRRIRWPPRSAAASLPTPP